MTFIPALGPALALIALLAGYYYFRSQNRRNKIAVISSVQQLITQPSQDPLSGSLRVSFGEIEVKDPRVVVLTIANMGNKDLESKNFDRDRPIKLSLSSTIISKGSDDNQAPGTNLNISYKDNEIHIGPDLISSRSDHTITAIVDGEPKITIIESPLINCDLVLQDEGATQNRFSERLGRAASITAIFSAILAAGIVFSQILANRQSEPQRQPISSELSEIIIDRAMSQIDVPYAWGGGDQRGPTKGIRDGGIADQNGDYNKIGFDASGLMIFAFGAAFDLPHYTGFIYDPKEEISVHIPFADRRPGDMIFYGPNATEHVALYLGDDLMIEAFESGQVVKISPVRDYGAAENVVRMLQP